MTKSTGSLEASDAAAAAVQKTPHRVTLESIHQKIDKVDYYNPALAPHFTLAVVKLTNGYVITGQSAPADPGNYDKDLGEKFSLEDAIRKVWALEGYVLCNHLAA